MRVNDRLKKVLNILNISIKELSKSTNIPYRTMQDYIAGKRNISIEAVLKICTQYGIKADYLICGKEPIFESEENKILNKIQMLSDEDKEIILKEIDKRIKYTEEINKMRRELEDIKKMHSEEIKKSESNQ